jgi:hypothetical protein
MQRDAACTVFRLSADISCGAPAHWRLPNCRQAGIVKDALFVEPDSKQNAWQGIDDNFRNFAQAGSNDYVLDDKVPSASVISTKSLSLR